MRIIAEKSMRTVFLSLLISACMLSLSSSGPRAQEGSPPHSEGQCDGSMKGYDGREYACGPHRKPACDTSGQRCVCVERVECGGKTNEPY